MKYNYEYAENDYKTPPILYNMALRYYNIAIFDLDTCCTDENIPALEYCKHYQRDGLKEYWRKYNWCNPPFNECKKWIIKAYNEQQKGNKTAMLIPVRTETTYWHDYILNNKNIEIVFLKKGYRFLNRDNEEMGIFKNALALIYFN